jgi:hypothetical protein
MPEKFKITTKWIVFSEAVDTYLNRLRGQGRIPLNYIIRTIEDPVAGTIYETEQEMLISTAPLTGDQFDLDNERVYGFIKQLILEGPAWSYITSVIDRTKNARGAWLAMRAHYEGESFLNKQKEETYKAIEDKGERSTLTFEHFTGILTKGYNDLQHYGEPVLEAKKVRDILSKVTDPKLENAKQAIRINPQYKNNFDLAINFLAKSVETLDRTRTRMISETQTQRGALHVRGGRVAQHNAHNTGRATRGRSHNAKFDRGTGRGYGGHGRGGRGRGRGRNDVNTSSYLPRSEWNAMTPEQKQTFLQTRAMSRINALSSIITPTDDVSAITTQTGSHVPTQIAQIQRDHSSVQSGDAPSVTVTSGPFGGRASHRG